MKEPIRVKLVGRLKKDPETRQYPSGKRRTYLFVRVDRGWDEGGETVLVQTQGRMAETCEETLKRGQRLYIKGKVGLLRWQKDNGDWILKITVTPRVLQPL